MLTVFIIGTAGAGKSSFTAAFAEWLKTARQDVSTVNLDPGAVTLPYSPDVDVRNLINLENLMEEYRLGPNGALIMAADLIADETRRLTGEIEELQSDIVLVDTSGQMELFAFRASGPYIASELMKETKAIIYLFDSVFSVNPLNYVSNLFLSTAVYNRFFLPQLHLISKSDLLPRDQVREIMSWSTNQKSLEIAIEQKLEGTRRLLSINMMQAIYKLGLRFPFVSVSAKTSEGMINVNAVLERIATGGEKYTY